jgi:putative peptide zinc metalloprotease protein
VGKFIHYLATSPKLERQRPRAIAVSLALFALIIGVLQFVPFPSHFRAPGVAQATQWTQVINETSGEVRELLATPGGLVSAGQPLVRLHSAELALSLNHARASQAEVETRIRTAIANAVPNLKPLFGQLEAATNRVSKLLDDQAALIIVARHDGLWVAPEMKEFVGRWIPRGTPLGLLVNPSTFQFTSAVKQEDAERLFARDLKGAEVRLYGQVDKVITARRWEVVPGGQRVLPSAALGWQAGGEMAVMPDDRSGTRSAEPFFEVHVEIPSDAGPLLLHGRTGRIRFERPPEPLLPRWIRSLRQLLQKRYQL